MQCQELHNASVMLAIMDFKNLCGLIYMNMPPESQKNAEYSSIFPYGNLEKYFWILSIVPLIRWSKNSTDIGGEVIRYHKS